MKNLLNRVVWQTLTIVAALFCVSQLYAAKDGYVESCTQANSHTITIKLRGDSWSLTTNLYNCKLFPQTGGFHGTDHAVDPFQGSKLNTAVASCSGKNKGVPVSYDLHRLKTFYVPLEWIPIQYQARANKGKRRINLSSPSGEYIEVHNNSWGCDVIPNRDRIGGGAGHKYL